MVVWDVSVNDHSHVDMWLETLRHRAGDRVPILLVGTHTDVKSMSDELVEERLKACHQMYSKRYIYIHTYIHI